MYCSTDDIISEFKDIKITATTPVKLDEVDDFILQSDSIIDSYISNKYVVPVTAGAGLELLKYISIQLTAERIRFIMGVKTGDEETTQDPTKKFLANPMDILKKISKGEMQLPGATEYTTQGVRSFVVGKNEKHVFKKCEEQW